MKLVCNCTVVMGLNSPSRLITASTMAVSAAAMMAWPHSTPPPCTSAGCHGQAAGAPSPALRLTCTRQVPAHSTQGATTL
jgi:hypothetical protein